MKTGFRKAAALFITSLLLVSVLPGGVWAEALSTDTREEKVAISGPLSPAFVKFQEDLKKGGMNVSGVGDHPRGHIPAPLERKTTTSTSDLGTSESLPPAYDLRALGRVTAIRDQEPYGSCWAFASYASLESYLKNNNTTDLSENNLMWNHGFDWGPNDGGNSSMAIAYLARWSGPINESNDPYGSPQKIGLSSEYHVQEVTFLPQSAMAIKQAIMDGGAVDTSIYSAELDNDYSNAAYYYDGNARVDHDVAIVGWDDHYARSNFKSTPPGDGAWIVKNSWGTGWGDEGYFYLSYYDTYAGYEATVFHQAESTDNYADIYQYDLLGQTGYTGYSQDTAWGANIFMATDSEALAAVSTYTLSPNTCLEIQIYTNVNAGDPVSGVLQETKTVIVPLTGYHTIELNTPVELLAEERFSIVVKYTTPEHNYPIPLEAGLFGYSSGVTANTGESFISYYGDAMWEDISLSEYKNVCIKGFTKASQVAELQSIAITTPATKLSYQIGDALDLTGLVVIGTYSDGTTKAETISIANISGFNSSTAATNQVLTITVDGKMTTYLVEIISSGEPGQGEMTGFLGQDPEGNNYFYDKTDFNYSYLSYQINPGSSSAKMYQHLLNNECRIVALKDLTKGYMDYNAAASASLLAQMKGQAFDINTYFGSSDAKVYDGDVSVVGIVDKAGNVSY